MKRFTLPVLAALLAITGMQRNASAQLLTPGSVRCQAGGGFGLLSDTAQRRYAWAAYCASLPDGLRGHYPGGAVIESTKYLTAASISYYNNDLDVSEKSRLFPVYYDFVSGDWPVPNALLTTGPDSMAYPTDPAVCRSTADIPSGLFPSAAANVGLCVAGCYVEGTQLQFADGPMGIKAAAMADKADLVTLSPTATLDNLQFTTNKVERYVTDYIESMQDIYTLSMASGGQLHVTSEHPLLTSDGIIHQAQGLSVGDRLVLASGKPDPIVRIKVNKVFGKVYNVRPVTTDYVSNIVVAGGYLNGSLRYQNEFLDMINALILRRALAEQAIEITTR